MEAILGPLVGFIGSTLPEVATYFTQRQNNEHEQEMARIGAEASSQEHSQEIERINVQADVDELERLLAHDQSISENVPAWVQGLRASVRPTITYMFFGLFLLVKIAALVFFISTNGFTVEMIPVIWDAETYTLFSAVITFWFGRRSIDHVRRSATDDRQVAQAQATARRALLNSGGRAPTE